MPRKPLGSPKNMALRYFDVAYAYEALARAHAASGNKEECKNFLQKAREAGNLIAGKEDKNIFDVDLESGPWFGCKPK